MPAGSENWTDEEAQAHWDKEDDAKTAAEEAKISAEDEKNQKEREEGDEEKEEDDLDFLKETPEMKAQ